LLITLYRRELKHKIEKLVVDCESGKQAEKALSRTVDRLRRAFRSEIDMWHTAHEIFIPLSEGVDSNFCAKLTADGVHP
jgi:hypothetical protein